ncbi:hypothetical protein MMC17_007468 [Xylographa soralifera]|nr:hypothetical protein [Xylographa soralifera]
MSEALLHATRLKPETRLAQAISEFEADLSDQQKASFISLRSQSISAPPSHSDVMQFTAEIDRRASQGIGGRRCFGTRFTNFLKAVQRFSALGDVIIGGSQNLIACGVWSLVRMSLLSIVQYSTYIEQLSTLLMNVGRLAPCYEQVALLYPRSQTLQSSLFEYFIVVVGLCHQVLRFTQKSRFEQFVSTLSNSETNAYQLELDRWASAIKEEMNLMMAKKIDEEGQENSRFRAFSNKQRERRSLERTMRTKQRILDACSTYEYQTAWKQIRKAGSATLFSGNAKYEDWRCQTDSCTLVYTGKLGSGKSVLLANIVDDLYLYAGNQNITVTYFFCRHDIHESLRARTIVGSLARQLLGTISDASTMAPVVDLSATALDVDGILELLRHTFLNKRKVYFILDGLDECGNAERDALLGHIRDLQKIFSLLLCISSRLEPDSASNLRPEQITAASFIMIPDLNPDIEAFIEAELEACITSEALIVGDPTIVIEIQDALMAGSQGMFLWVALQIVSLCSMGSDYAIRQALADLPKDLSEAFSRALRRPERSERTYQRQTFELIIAALRPLTTEEFREALSVVPGDTHWNPERLLNNIKLTLSYCGGLVIIDEEELTVRLAHHSIKQFLLKEYEKSTAGAIKIEDTNRKMIEIVLTYLNYDVFETQLSTRVIPQIDAASIPNIIIESTFASSSKDSPSNIRGSALKLIKFEKRPNHDIGKTIAETSRGFKSPLRNEFHFHVYAKTFWFQHSICIAERASPMYALLLKTIRKKSADVDIKDQDGRTLLFWAVENEHEAIVKALLEIGKVNADSKDQNGRTPLSWAAEKGQEAVVIALLKTGKVDADSKDQYGQTPLWWAAEKGYEAVVKALLKTGKVNADSKGQSGRTPLWWAAEKGHEAVVKALLETGKVDADSKDQYGRKPLWWAAEKGHEAVIQALLKTGKVDVNSKDQYGQTPLSWAAEKGHEAVVKALLETGKVNTNLKDQYGRTPLWWAAENGHEAVVKLLK